MATSNLFQFLKVTGGLALAAPALVACDALCKACCAAAGSCSAVTGSEKASGCCAATEPAAEAAYSGCCAAAN